MWRRFNRRCLVVAASLSVVAGCYYDKEDLLYAGVSCDTMEVSFNADILPILSNSCSIVGCHIQGGSGTGLFENYQQVSAKVSNGSLARRVLIQRDMPPSEPLSDCQLEHIRQWLDQGAPNN